EADIRHALELQYDVEPFARLAQLGEAGSLAPGARQRRIAPAPSTAMGDDHGGTAADEIGDQPTVHVLNHGSIGYRQDRVGAGGPAGARARAALAVLGTYVRREVEVEQRVYPRIDGQHDAAAVAAVASVGPAERLELPPVDRHAAGPAVAGLHV